jgi:hypothetical protein
MPAIAAFWVSSKLALPETISTWLLRGSFPSSSAPAQDLVHGVVPAHVLSDRDQFAGSPVEQARRMESARAVEDLLFGPQGLRHLQNEVLREAHRVIGHGKKRFLVHLVNARATAHAAGAGHQNIAFLVVERREHPLVQDDVDRVVAVLGSRAEVLAAVSNGRDLLAVGDDALAQEEPGGQGEVLGRRPHGHGETTAVDPDFERFFGGHHVGPGIAMTFLINADDSGAGFAAAHWTLVLRFRVDAGVATGSGDQVVYLFRELLELVFGGHGVLSRLGLRGQTKSQGNAHEVGTRRGSGPYDAVSHVLGHLENRAGRHHVGRQVEFDRDHLEPLREIRQMLIGHFELFAFFSTTAADCGGLFGR